MDKINSYDIPKINLEEVNKLAYDFYKAKALLDNYLTYKPYSKSKTKEPKTIPLDIDIAKNNSYITPKDLQYLKLYPSNIKNIIISINNNITIDTNNLLSIDSNSEIIDNDDCYL